MSDVVKFEDSNIALLGSDLEKKVKLAAAETEAMWQDAGKEPGIKVWRVEKLAINHWPEQDTGKFYQGDSYIVLHTFKKKDVEALQHNVHFWLGKDTTQDEAGVAAYKTVELDTLLGDVPVQYREVMDHESNQFLNLFGGKLAILAGGIESGFRQVKPEEYQPKLLHVRRPAGSKHIYVHEAQLSWRALNQGDVFILDKGLEIVTWQGTGANAFEKNKARDVVQVIRAERNGKPKSIVIDGDENDEVFFGVVGNPEGGVDGIAKEAPAQEDTTELLPKKMFSVSDDGGSLTMTPVEFKRDNLESDNVMIVDSGSSIYVWAGRGASKAETQHGMQFAMSYLAKFSRPMHTPICRLQEGAETAAFDAVF